jgi:hypothetical protein
MRQPAGADASACDVFCAPSTRFSTCGAQLRASGHLPPTVKRDRYVGSSARLGRADCQLERAARHSQRMRHITLQELCTERVGLLRANPNKNSPNGYCVAVAIGRPML